MKYILLALMLSMIRGIYADQYNSSCTYSFKRLPEGGFRVIYEFDALTGDQQLEIAKNCYTACQNHYLRNMRNTSIVATIMGLASGMMVVSAHDDSGNSNRSYKRVGKKILTTIMSVGGGVAFGLALCELYSHLIPENSFVPNGFCLDKDVFDIKRLCWEAELGISEQEGSYEKAMKKGQSIFFGQSAYSKVFGSFEAADYVR